MVKVIRRTQEEKDLGKKTRELKDISKKVLIDENEARLLLSAPSRNSFCFQDVSGHPVFVSPEENYLSVESEKYFDIAFKLASAYEKHTGEKWTLKKEYED